VSDDVGSVGEEAAKLLQALQGWAKEGADGHAGAATSQGWAKEGAASAWRHVDEHVATGGGDCRYCPLCQVISAVRGTSPEVRQHLATAATSLMQAAAGMLATAVPEPGDERGRRQEHVQKIDLDDQEWEDER
jgi:hypothetical protein